MDSDPQATYAMEEEDPLGTQLLCIRPFIVNPRRVVSWEKSYTQNIFQN